MPILVGLSRCFNPALMRDSISAFEAPLFPRLRLAVEVQNQFLLLAGCLEVADVVLHLGVEAGEMDGMVYFAQGNGDGRLGGVQCAKQRTPDFFFGFHGFDTF